MSKIITVLLVGPLPPAIGGISTYIFDLLNSDLKLKYNLITYPTSHPRKNHRNQIIKSSTKNKLVQFDFIEAITVTLYQMLKFPSVIFEKNPDIIHLHTASYLSFFENSIYVIISRVLGKRTIMHIHGGAFNKFYENSSFLLKLYIKIALSLPSKVVCLSPYWKNYLIEDIGVNSKKIDIVSNGYDGLLFYPMDSNECKKKLNLPIDKKIILNVANLLEEKGQIYLIKGMKYVVSQNTDVLCLIIGEGKLKADFEQEIKMSGLENYVKLLGSKAHDEIPYWMNACDIFILPSLIESFGLAQIEAMGCGKPIIATYNGGSEEIIACKEYGFLCETANAKLLAENILLAMNMEFDTNKIQMDATKFKWDNVSGQIKKLYEEVLNEF